MTDVFVIDYGPMEDLMFWNRFARLLKERGADAPPALILLGSGERVQALLGGPGAAPRTDGVLRPAPADVRKLERGMREELQSVVTLLTDEGIPAVGFSGLDRNLLRLTENGPMETEDGASSIFVGSRALESVTKWTAKGVIPIISCLARTSGENVKDVHPAVVAGSVADSLTETRIMLVAQRLTDSIRTAMGGVGSAGIEFSDVAGALAEEALAGPLSTGGRAVHVTHPDLEDVRSPPRIVLES